MQYKRYEILFNRPKNNTNDLIQDCERGTKIVAPANQTDTHPLAVDLDGTLIHTDLLLESGLAFLRQRPLQALAPFLWLMRGRAVLKARLAQVVNVDVAVLPYNFRVLQHLKMERAKGRRIILATASHKKYAEAVARHLGIFDQVIATDSRTNLAAEAKRDALVAQYGEKGFDYIGNGRDDLPVWAAARKADLVNPPPGVENRARAAGNVEEVLYRRSSVWKEWPRALRLHQWLKNLLLFVPLLASHQFMHPDLVINGLLAFLCFGLCASSVYLLNDLMDLEDDRHHPSKCLRPFASGALPLWYGLMAFPLLILLGFSLSVWLLPTGFTLSMAAYYVLTLFYSLVLKQFMVVDVIVLALLYTTRLIAGTFAIDVIYTFWMLAFSMFIFLSLALVKRYTELRQAHLNGRTEKTRGRGYYAGDLEMISAMGAASGYLAVLVLALYIRDEATLALYARPEMIWPACPLLLFWISRVWLLAHRGKMHDDPVVFAIKDRSSILVGLIFGLVFWLAT